MPPEGPEKRQHARINTLNLLSYTCLDTEGNEVDQGMGRTLNISAGGLLMETLTPIDSDFILLMAVGLQENFIEIKGRVAFCREGREGREGKWETGIAFLDRSEQARRVLVEFVRAALRMRPEGDSRGAPPPKAQGS
jgi:c-di-GMP-binding flagellar brake protein YcgR